MFQRCFGRFFFRGKVSILRKKLPKTARATKVPPQTAPQVPAPSRSLAELLCRSHAGTRRFCLALVDADAAALGRVQDAVTAARKKYVPPKDDDAETLSVQLVHIATGSSFMGDASKLNSRNRRIGNTSKPSHWTSLLSAASARYERGHRNAVSPRFHHSTSHLDQSPGFVQATATTPSSWTSGGRRATPACC